MDMVMQLRGGCNDSKRSLENSLARWCHHRDGVRGDREDFLTASGRKGRPERSSPFASDRVNLLLVGGPV